LAAFGIFALGMMCGAALQKYYGLKNLVGIAGLENRPFPVTAQISLRPVLDTGFGIPETYHGKLLLFILGGQSNMSGRGEIPSEQ
jgi:hypothetical protein